MIDGGCDLVSGGTDTHLMLVDLRKKGVTGKAAEASLGRAYITCNKNGIPFDPAPFTITSGIRLGTPAGTTRGFGPAEFKQVGALITEVLDGLAANGEEGNGKVEASVAQAGQGADRPLPDLLTRSMRWPGLTRPPRLGTVTRPPAAAGGIRGFPGALSVLLE